ncbi:hypothetical protein Scep_000871 [Stephania cephalantha]|uniref:BEACH domain-containing protein B n=1 Tax=Stephania cephalantha TaxID=152367 RepID=A0AAP0L7Z5_9MAGN
MNIVKGVADLLRRTSGGGLSGESQSGRFAAPSPTILFSDIGDEGILNSLWKRHEKAVDKVEKRKLFHVFLKQFLIVYKYWEPHQLGQLPGTGLCPIPANEYVPSLDDLVIGCQAGHPAEVILGLTEEITELTALISELNMNTAQSSELHGASISVSIITEGFPILEALTVITRSMHNCRVFGYYGGMQKLIALMKAAVIQLKTAAGALAQDDNLSKLNFEKTKVLQRILVYVVSIICCFIELNSNVCLRAQIYTNTFELSNPKDSTSLFDPSDDSSYPDSELRLQWRQKAIVSVMEAGGLNWLVELLRVIKRLSMKEQWVDLSLQYLTLSALKSSLVENLRAQNHFRSIGGLEVLLDGLGFSSNKTISSRNVLNMEKDGNGNLLPAILQLQVLSLEVLREAVFGNLGNLQFLCENGRVHKFANSICWPAFMLQDSQQWNVESSLLGDYFMALSDSGSGSHAESYSLEPTVSLDADGSCFKCWGDYAIKLSRVLCSFLLALKDIRFHSVQASIGRNAVPISAAYWELSIKWVLKVLFTVFPCIKACSNQNELPRHLRILVSTLQHYILYTFRKVLVSLPSLLHVFREEGIWDLIFSENFFYFEPNSEGTSGAFSSETQIMTQKLETPTASNSDNDQSRAHEVEILQIEIISFVEFVATLNGSTHNSPECSVLLDALEQSACYPELASVLAKSLHRILQLTVEQTTLSFKSLDAISRVLKVACIQAQEYRRSESFSPVEKGSALSISPNKMDQSWLKCMETILDLVTEFLAIADDARRLVLHKSACIDSLFDLFWEEALRKDVLAHILDLMKLPSSSEEDQISKLYLCSKYLETFTYVKERESNFVELSIDLLVGVRDLLQIDQMYYQSLFRDGECFLHIVSLLNCNLDEQSGELLVLNVLHTLTCLLSGNDNSKVSFRALVGKGYKALQNLLLDFCQSHPSEGLLHAILDMLADGNFDIKVSPLIKNEDVIILYLSVLQKSSESLRHLGLDVVELLLKDSISNRASCVRAGMLNFLLDWFLEEDNSTAIAKVAKLVEVIGGHSISGKDIRKIFALLRNEKIRSKDQHRSLLMSSILYMLNEKGPTAFFDHFGNDSGIVVRTPLQWPLVRGFSFSCWIRVENFPMTGTMGLFSFLTENGRGCFSSIGKDRLLFVSIGQKRQGVSLHLNLVRKKWHFLCITHIIGRAFSGGSLLRCYIDGNLVSSEKCRYPKFNDALTLCTVGTKIIPPSDEDEHMITMKDSSPFYGQIGPVYMFSDAISSEEIQGIYSLGPSYMYSFLDNEDVLTSDNPLPDGILSAKDGLASKIIFGINAQASNGKTLFNVSQAFDNSLDKSTFEAMVMAGTQLCSRRLLQEIIYCVGGVTVFFPLLTEFDRSLNPDSDPLGDVLLRCVMRDCLTAEVIELIAYALDENPANQQQMHLLSGFSILGFLLQSLPPNKINLETLSALKHLFNVVANSGLTELLVKDAILSIFLNPFIWLYTSYEVQRELYMFLIYQFDNDPRLLSRLCRLPRVIDIIQQFYWDQAKSRYAYGGKPLLHPVSKEVIGERPSPEDVRKIRLLLLSLGEMSLRQNIAESDIKALVAFFEKSQDMTCIEDVLHMVTRAVSQKPLLASFLEQVNLLCGCQMFVNLLNREHEQVRLLGLQFLGRLLVGLPSEKKGARFFSLAVGRSRLLSESHKKIDARLQPIFSAMSDRLFQFPQTDLLCATLFDVLLGGASPKQVLQKQNQHEKLKTKGNYSHFLLPQILVLIFRFFSNCSDILARVKILKDLLDLLDSSPSNIVAFMEYGWNSWLATSVGLDIFKKCRPVSHDKADCETTEQNLARELFCVVLSYYMHSVKGGWHHLEETMNFLLVRMEQGENAYGSLVHVIFEDLIERLIALSSELNIFVSQPCRDNTLYLLKLIDEILVSEMGHKLPYPGSSSEFSPDCLEFENFKDHSFAKLEDSGNIDYQLQRALWVCDQNVSKEDYIVEEKWWNMYDKVWIIIGLLNGKGPNKMLPKSSSSVGPSLGQRARGLVESLNIPAAEMAAVVVSGGISNALSGKPNKLNDKAMILRGEKCPRVVFRLLALYLCKSSLERASRCVQQVVPIIPCLLAADDEQTKSRLQLFIWSLLTIKSQFGTLDDGARLHVISHLIRETVNCGKSILATSITSKDDSSDSVTTMKESGTVHALIQNDKVLSAVAEEDKYMKNLKSDRARQLQELNGRLHENSSSESSQRNTFEGDVQNSLTAILSSDDSRRAAFQLTHDEDQEIVAEKWVRMFRTVIDERGPWSANPFPNSIATHWKLDKTEDSWRRRPKLKRNYCYDESLCCPPITALTKDANDIPNEKTKPGTPIPEQMKRLLLKGVRRITDEGSIEPQNETEDSKQPENTADGAFGSHLVELIKDSINQKDLVQERKELTSSVPETEISEVLICRPCVLVKPKRKVAGHLAVMKNVLHFFGEFLVEGTGGSSVFNSFNALINSEYNSDQIGAFHKRKLPKWPSNVDAQFEKGQNVNVSLADRDNLLKREPKVKRHRRWEVSKVKSVHWTRYLLRYTAIEIFFSNSVAPVFFNFASQKDAKEVGKLIVSARNECLFPKGSLRDRSGVIAFLDRRAALEMAENAQERWRRREISNFEYLMVLNTLAGRSYNDLTQYPVFPWVLADYSSTKLDFNKSSTFRDLSKPVGALDAKRFEVFDDRYRNFSDPDIPSFYYGSHYSSMGIVLFYLLRLEPFTALHRNLQGGKFDHADRLFQSIEGTFRNCMSNTSDVKELIPEFFYMPDFLINSNSYHLGIKQDGEPLGHVSLPPWAQGSPEEFIQKNREALESEYVSSNLHLWIDLVFGYKQRGKPAEEAANIFYYLTYEGAVDLETMEDELQRSAIEDQIANFGQTPIQVFRKKHPRRGPPIPIAHPLYFAPSSIDLTSIISSTTHPPSSILYIDVLDSCVVLVNQGLTMSVKMWLTTQLQSGGNLTFSGSQDPFFGIGSDIISPRKIGSHVAENVELGAQFFVAMQTTSENFLISCGNWENSFQVISLNDGRTVQTVRQHKDVVSCVAVTTDGTILATGSYDTTVMVWEVCRARPTEKRVRSSQVDVPRKDYVIVDTPFHILCGHDDIITCLFVSIELDIVISGSKDGTCIFHTLREGRYVRSLQHPSGCALSKLVASQHGRIAFYAEDDLSLNLYSINGKHIATSESNGRLNCVELSVCGEYLVCAGDHGHIVVRSMNSLEVVKRYDGIGKVITSLAVTQEECFLAGTKEGILLVYSIENPQLRRSSLPRNVKSKVSAIG